MKIRLAEYKDLEALMDFYIRMNEIINKRTDKYDPENPVFPSREMVVEAMEQGMQFIGMEGDDIAIACILSHDCDPAYMTIQWQLDIRQEEFSVIHALRVAPEYEGRGYARQMIAYAIEHARNCGQKAIRLDVLEGYSVEKMYLSQGFTYMDTVEIFYEDIGYPQRFRLLELVL